MKSTTMPQVLLTLKQLSGIKQKEHRGYAANLEESVGTNGCVTEYCKQNNHSDSQFIQEHEQMDSANGLL